MKKDEITNSLFPGVHLNAMFLEVWPSSLSASEDILEGQNPMPSAGLLCLQNGWPVWALKVEGHL